MGAPVLPVKQDDPEVTVGVKPLVELGEINPDPKALTQYYVGIRDSDGEGEREHYGVGGELLIPVFDFLDINAAGRYDHYSYADNDFGEFTYNLGAELRPTDTLLLRAASALPREPQSARLVVQRLQLQRGRLRVLLGGGLVRTRKEGPRPPRSMRSDAS